MNRMNTLWRWAVIPLLVCLSFGLQISFPWVENQLLDYAFQFRGPLPTDARIVLIDIDDDSIAKIGRWPWNRTVHANMITLLAQSGVSTIGYDILFSDPSDDNADIALAHAIKQANNVVLPIGVDLIMTDTGFNIARELRPLSLLGGSASMIGHIASHRDSDGTIRRVPLAVLADGRPFPSFSLAVLLVHFRTSLEKMQIHLGWSVILQNIFLSEEGIRKDMAIPIDSQGQMHINYAGRWTDTFQHFSFSDLLDAGKTEAGRSDLVSALRGKICIISNTATGYDLKPTPLEKAYPGGGIHANAINTVLTGQYLQPVGWASAGIATLLLAILIATTTLKISIRIGIGTTFFCIIAYLLTAFFLFIRGWVAPIVAPPVTFASTFLMVLLNQFRLNRARLASTTAEKNRIKEDYQKTCDALSIREGELATTRKELSGITAARETLQAQIDQKLREIAQLESKLVVSEGEKKNIGEAYLKTCDDLATQKDAVILMQRELTRLSGLESKLETATRETERLVGEKEKLERKYNDSIAASPVVSGKVKQSDTEIQKECSECGIITCSESMFELFRKAKKVADSEVTVLLQGETGTGKEVLARFVHQHSPRAHRPFIAINCAAVPETLLESELFGYEKGAFTGALARKPGKFKLAHTGTLLLDEVSEMQLSLQAKLLRVLQEKEVDSIGGKEPISLDLRIIATTNRPIFQEVEAGRFREDLYYRLKGLPLVLPPLRERQKDIPLLANHFIKEFSKGSKRGVNGISKEAMNRLVSHRWPGNVRELEHCIERAVIMAEGDMISSDDVQFDSPSSDPPNEDWADLSDADFLKCLHTHRFKIKEMAKQKKVERLTVSSRLLGICFKALADHEGNISRAAKSLAHENTNPDFVRNIEEKMQEYYGNLLDGIKGYREVDPAVKECRRRYEKNVRQEYLDSMDTLIKKYFENNNA